MNSNREIFEEVQRQGKRVGLRWWVLYILILFFPGCGLQCVKDVFTIDHDLLQRYEELEKK